MLKIGNYNTLTVKREVDFGFYLSTDDGREILMPGKYAPAGLKPGDDIKVIVYTDSEDRLVATTEHPFACVGEFAYLQVKDVNATGAFLDWGLTKDLLVPFSQQRMRMNPGGIYLVYIYLDDVTQRVVASAKVDRFLGNVIPEYKTGQAVTCLVTEHTDRGYRAIVDNRHRGMIYDNEIFRPLELQQTITAFVKKVRDDGKIDLTLSDKAVRRVGDLSERILESLQQNGGVSYITDNSTPDQIEAAFSCSKKDYKKALGHLYKEGRIMIGRDKIVLTADTPSI